MEEAVGTARFYNAYLPQVEQPRYNMLDRHIEPEILPTAAKYGMGLVVFSPLAQGLLTGKYNDGIPEGTRAASSTWLDRDLNEANLAKAREITALAQELDLTPAQLALAWILRRPEISSAITGASKPRTYVGERRGVGSEAHARDPRGDRSDSGFLMLWCSPPPSSEAGFCPA